MRTTPACRRRAPALIAVLVLALLTACSGDPEQAAVEQVPEPAGASTARATPPSADAPPDGQGAVSEPAAAAEPPAAALASTTMSIGFVDGGELEAAVTGLEVTGGLLRLAITFTASLPPETEQVGLGAILKADQNAPAAGVAPTLIDPANLKAYELVAGGLRHGTTMFLRNGTPRTVAFYYAAPQDEVETFDVVLASESAPITDVPLQP